MIVRSGRAVAVAAFLGALLVSSLAPPALARPKPEGEIRWAVYVTLTPLWFDPAEVVGQLTPFWVLINPYPWSAPLEEVRLKRN